MTKGPEISRTLFEEAGEEYPLSLDFEAQKRGVPYLTKEAMINPSTMIRMGEVQEQGATALRSTPNAQKHITMRA